MGVMYQSNPATLFEVSESGADGTKIPTRPNAQARLFVRLTSIAPKLEISDYLYTIAAVGPPQGENPTSLVHAVPLLSRRYKSPPAKNNPVMITSVYVYKSMRTRYATLILRPDVAPNRSMANSQCNSRAGAALCSSFSFDPRGVLGDDRRR